MAHDVFISYSTKNATVADTVCAGLERRGIGCWIAPRDIEPGQDFPSAIINAIDTCKVFVIIVSAASTLSDDVLRELQNAASNGIPIIPFRIEDIVLSPSMRYFLGTPQWLDALTEPLEQHVVRLADTVGGLLGRAVPEEQPTASEARQPAPAEPAPSRPPTASRLRASLRAMSRGALISAIALLLAAGAYMAMRGAGHTETADVPQITPDALTAPETIVPPEPETSEATEPPVSGPTVVLPQPVPRGKPWEKRGTRVGQEIVGPDGGSYVWVPAGSFMMGSEDGGDDEKPVHQVELDGFWLGKYEVTNAQYRAFCHAIGREFPAISDQGQNHPVVWVSRDDARSYCAYYDLRLPTEAQWEYAAAGTESRKYPWGDEWDQERLCWSEWRLNGGSFPVGSFAAGASWCGALDMAGNVREWCADWYGDYAKSPVENPPGPSTGYFRVLRGGAWSNCYEDDFRCAARDSYRQLEDGGGGDMGFRCARTVP